MKMNVKHMIATVIALVAAGSAFADATSNTDDFPKFASTKARAEVISELTQAEADGSFVATEGKKYPSVLVASNKTRAEVIQELRQAKADGSYARSVRNYYGQ
jgi:hypothetical protein